MAKNEKRTLNIRALLIDEVSTQLTDIRKAVEKTGKTIEKGNKKNAKSFRAVADAVKFLTGAFLALKSVQVLKSLANTTDQIGKLANATGDTVEQISLLSYAFESAGGNADSFKSVLSSLLSSQKGALGGAKEQANAFRELGFSMSELRKMSPATMLAQMAEGFGKIEDSTRETQLLATLFPEQWRNVINLIDGGGKMFQDRLRDAKKAGAEVTTQQVQASADIIDGFLKLETAIQNVGRELLVTFGPALTTTLESIAKLFNENKGVIVDLSITIRDMFVKSLGWMIDAIIEIIELVEKIPGTDLSRSSGASENLQKALAAERTALVNVETFGQRMPALLTTLQAELAKAHVNVVQAQAAVAEEIKNGIPQVESLSGYLRRGKEQFGREFAALTESLSSETGPIREAGKDIGKSFGDGFFFEASDAVDKFLAELHQMQLDQSADENDPFIDWKKVDAGWEEGIGGLQSQAEEFDRELGKGLAVTVKGVFDGFANGLAGIIDGTKSAKEAWKDFARSTLALIAQLIAKMAALKITQALFALADGGVLPGVNTDNALPVQNYARGGIAKSPQLAVFGEGNRNEAFVPLPDNRSIPVTFTGSQPGQGQQVNVNVYAWDSKDAARGLIENRSVLQSIFTQQADNQNGMRQTLQRAVS